MDTVPFSASVRLHCQTVAAAVRAVPVVKLMPSDMLSRLEISFCPGTVLDLHIPEPDQFSRRICSAPYRPDKRPFLSVSVFHFLMQVHESSALRQTGHACFQSLSYRRNHPCVSHQLFSVKLRISTAQQQAVQSFRKRAVPKRAERDQSTSEILQQRQIVFVIETECLIPGNTDAKRFLRTPGQRLFRCSVRLLLHGPCCFPRDLSHQLKIHGPAQKFSRSLHLCFQSVQLLGRHQPEVTAFHTEAGRLRQISDHRNIQSHTAKFALQHFLKPGIEHVRHSVQKDSADPAVFPELCHPFHYCRKREGSSSARQDKQDRQVQCARHIVGACPVRVQRHAVIVSHHTLCDSDIRPLRVSDISPDQLFRL